VPTLLQSLGSILEHSPSVYELYGRQIVNSIQDILMSTELISTSGQSSLDGNSTCCCSCKLKVYCLKALVKGFLPRIARARINGILGKLLEYEKGLFPDIALCENDSLYLQLAAGKCVLKLATRWDSHISPELFRNTILMARDPSYIVRKSFICKLYGLLKRRAIPVRYACALALASTDCSGDVRAEVNVLFSFLFLCQISLSLSLSLSIYVYMPHNLYVFTGFPCTIASRQIT